MEIKKPEIEEKVWGYEEKIVNNDRYCGKRLHLEEGYRCSIHRHEKDETFYIERGLVYLELENNNGETEHRILKPREVVHIPLNKKHRFSGLEKSVIIEFSTSDTESERFTNSEKIPDFKNWRKEILAKKNDE